MIDKVTGELYAVININNMISVPDFCITQLKYDKIANFRTFLNEKEKTDYIYLLQKEKLIIDNIDLTLQSKAQKLYQKCLNKPNSSLPAWCCNFLLLEEKCKCYNKEKWFKKLVNFYSKIWILKMFMILFWY